MNYHDALQYYPEVMRYRPDYEHNGLDWDKALNDAIYRATEGIGGPELQIVVRVVANILKGNLAEAIARKAATPAKTNAGMFLRLFYYLFGGRKPRQ